MNERIKMKREAGATTRWHVLPHIGVDTVASHSWNAVTLLLELNPSASRALIIYVLNHDVPERWTGDVPTFCKRMFPAVQESLKAAEGQIECKLNLPCLGDLPLEDQHWAEAVDALESALWCWEQLRMGNQMVDDTMKYLAHYIMNEGWMPSAVMVFYQDYCSERTTDYVIGGKSYGQDNE